VSSEQIKAWFSACDRDRNGVVDEHEFFLFSIQSASRQAGFDVGGLADALVRTYDKSGDGEMDRKEFTAMATTLGFGEIANTLFDSFDADGSAVISIGEICAHVHRMMQTQTKSVVKAVQSERDFVMAMALNAGNVHQVEQRSAEELRQGAPLVKRTTIWRLEEALKQKQFYTVGDAEEELEAFRKELSDALIKQGKSVSILFAAMDRDGDHPCLTQGGRIGVVQPDQVGCAVSPKEDR